MVTIIVPIYNTADYLDQCIESLVNQSYKDLEIILINDGSTDSSGDICEKWQKKDARIKYLYKKNEGQGKARSIGIKQAQGKYILFVDSDDYIDTGLIEKISGYMEQNKVEVCQFAYNIVSEKKVEKISVAVKVKETATAESCSQFLCQMSPVLCDKMYSAKLLQSISHPMENTMCEDLLFLPEVLIKANGIASVDEALYHYRNIRSGNMSTNFHRYHEVLMNVERLALQFKEKGWLSKYWRELYSISFHIFKDILFRLSRREDMELPQEARNMYGSFLISYENFFAKELSDFINADVMKARYLLVGGYGLRVIIRELLLEESRLVEYYGSSSIVSMMSTSLDKEVLNKMEITAQNPYRKQQVVRDIHKSFLQDDPFQNIDYVVIDFMEEIADLIEIDGTFITESEFFQESCTIPEKLSKRRCAFLSKERRTLFQEAADKLAALLMANHMKVIVIKNFLNTRYSDVYDDFSFYEDAEEIRAKNEELEWCYEYFRMKMPTAVCVDTHTFEDLQFTYKDFQFGCLPIYSNNGYYRYMATEIANKLI